MTANLHDLLRARAQTPPRPRWRRRRAAASPTNSFSLAPGRMARALADLGVEPGDRVAAQIDKSPDGIVLALACFRAGAALLPLNTAYTLAELSISSATPSPR